MDSKTLPTIGLIMAGLSIFILIVSPSMISSNVPQSLLFWSTLISFILAFKRDERLTATIIALNLINGCLIFDLAPMKPIDRAMFYEVTKYTAFIAFLIMLFRSGWAYKFVARLVDNFMDKLRGFLK